MRNPEAASQLTTLLSPLGARSSIMDVIRAAGHKVYTLALGEEQVADKKVACPMYTAGVCPFADCNSPHKRGQELPKGYNRWLHDNLQPGSTS